MVSSTDTKLMQPTQLGVQGITEDDIVEFLIQTPGFFERHADVLASIRLSSPHGTRAVSLQERQMEMLRERAKGLEHQIIDLIRHGHENTSLSEKLHRWTCALMQCRCKDELPGLVVAQIQNIFEVPQCALRLWDLAPKYAGLPECESVRSDIRSLAEGLTKPLCGLLADSDVLAWLKASGSVASMAMVALRHPHNGNCLGLLALGSPEKTRFAPENGTEFLQQIGDIASAALSRLL